MGRAFIAGAAAAVCLAQDLGDQDEDEQVNLLANRLRVNGGLENCISASESMSFPDYTTKFERNYKDGEEYGLRQSLFESRQQDVLHHNCQPELSWSATVNHLSDRTDEERSALFGWKHQGRSAAASLLQETRGNGQMSDDSFSVQKDWRLNATEEVKDQGSCGSSWAVATINMLEAHWEINHPANPVKFAIQDIVDCVDNPEHCGGTGGCEGGTVELAMEYIQGNNLNTAVGNRYLGKDTNKNACNPQSGGFSAAQLGVGRYRTLPSNKAEPVMLALQSGPVAVALEANNKWFHYKTGIVDGCNQKDTTINHAVLLTGYGQDEAGKKY